MIKTENGKHRYFDKNGAEIIEGCKVKYANGRIEKIYKTNDGRLGTDATNPQWLASGRACACEYGIYPLTTKETEEIQIV